jgi:hypothetical protein
MAVEPIPAAILQQPKFGHPKKQLVRLRSSQIKQL